MLIPLLTLALYLPATDSMGSALYRDCKADIRVMDSSTGGESSDLNPAEDCIQYVAGFTDALTISHQICPPDGVSRATLIRIYIAYMDKYPKLFDQDRAMGLWGALAGAYPCSTH